MKVTIKAGTFGYNHDGRYDLIRAGETIDVPEKIAMRLIDKGVAEIISEPEQAPTETQTVTEERSLEEMTTRELRELASQYGLEFNAKARKVDIIAAIEAEMQDAPSFDAAEAIQ